MILRIAALLAAIIMLICPARAQIRLLYPNGGEYFAFKDTITAQWTGVDPETAVHLSFSYDKGKTWSTVAAIVKGLSASFECYDGPANGLLRVAVATDSTNQDQSDSIWYIRRPDDGPNSTMDVDTIAVGEYIDTTITGGVINNGPVPMYVRAALLDSTNFQLLDPKKIIVVPVGASPTLRVRFRPTDSGTFKVGIWYNMRESFQFGGGHIRGTARLPKKEKLLITSPTGGRYFHIGDTVKFTWTGISTATPVRIEARKEGTAEYRLIEGGAVGGELRWVLPPTMQGRYWLRFTSTEDSQQTDTLPGLVTFAKPDVSVPEVVDVGKSGVNDTKNTQGFVVKSSSDLPVRVTILKIEGAHADEFIPSVTAFTMGPNSEYRPLIKFTPKGAGVREATLTTVVTRGDTLLTLLRGEGVVPSSVEAVTGEGLRKNRALRQYPNPTHGITTIEINLEKAGHTRLYLHDLMGREVAVLVDQSLSEGLSRLSYDMNDLPAGIYYLVLERLSQRETVRIVVE